MSGLLLVQVVAAGERRGVKMCCVSGDYHWKIDAGEKEAKKGGGVVIDDTARDET